MSRALHPAYRQVSSGLAETSGRSEDSARVARFRGLRRSCRRLVTDRVPDASPTDGMGQPKPRRSHRRY
jgi:hypothetical protein